MVEITTTDTTITVSSPYHPDFPAQARKLGGKFGPDKAWTFDIRDEARVRALCLDIYGTDGSAQEDLVTLRLTFEKADATYDCQVFAAGRSLARSFDRDGGARLSDGVVVLNGGFGSSGSRKNPNLTWNAGTVVEVRDVPRPAAEKALADGGEWTSGEIITDDDAPSLAPALERRLADLLTDCPELGAVLRAGRDAAPTDLARIIDALTAN